MSDIQLTTSADIQKLLSAMDRLEKKVGQTAQSSDKLEKTSDRQASTFGRLTKAATGFVAALGAREVARFATELYGIGAASERAETALDGLTDGRADEYIEAIGDASLGTISKMDAMASANRALKLGVVETSEEVAQLTEVAAALGRVMGMDATAAFNDLVTGIGRASPMILDNLGITLKMGQIQSEVNRLMREDATLTEDAAQKRAILNMVLAQGNDIIASTGGLTRDAAADAEAMGAAWSDLKAELGKAVAEGFRPAVREAGNLLRKINELNEAQKDAKAEALRSADGVEEYAKALEEAGYIVRQGTLLESEKAFVMELTRQEYERGRFELYEYGRAIDDAGMATARMIERSREAELRDAERLRMANLTGESFRALADDAVYLAEAEDAQAASTERNQKALEAMMRAAEAAFEKQKALAGIAEDLTGNFDYLGRTYTTVVGQNQQMIDLAEDLTTQQQRLNDAIFREQFAWEAAGGDAEEHAETLERLHSDLSAVEAQLGLATSRIGGYEESIVATRLSTEDLQEVGEGFLSLMSNTGREVEMQGVLYDRLRAKYGLVTEEQLNMEKGLRFITEAIDGGRLSIEEASRVFDAWVTGAIPDLQGLYSEVGTIEDAQQRVIDKLDRTGFSSSTMADESEAANERVSSATEDAIMYLAQAERKLLNIRGIWMGLQASSILNLHINSSGSIGGGGNEAWEGTGPSPGVTARAAGGPVRAGGRYIVGERGPELFVPQTSGSIVPNHALGGGSTPVQIHITQVMDGRRVGQMSVEGTLEALAQRGYRLEAA